MTAAVAWSMNDDNPTHSQGADLCPAFDPCAPPPPPAFEESQPLDAPAPHRTHSQGADSCQVFDPCAAPSPPPPAAFEESQSLEAPMIDPVDMTFVEAPPPPCRSHRSWGRGEPSPHTSCIPPIITPWHPTPISRAHSAPACTPAEQWRAQQFSAKMHESHPRRHTSCDLRAPRGPETLSRSGLPRHSLCRPPKTFHVAPMLSQIGYGQPSPHPLPLPPMQQSLNLRLQGARAAPVMLPIARTTHKRATAHTALAEKALLHRTPPSSTFPSNARKRKTRLPKSVNIQTALDLKAPRGDPYMLSLQELHQVETQKAKMNRRRERQSNAEMSMEAAEPEAPKVEAPKVEGQNGYWVEFMGVKHWMSEVDPAVIRERKERQRIARLELRGVNVKKEKIYPTLWRAEPWEEGVMCKTSTVRVRRCAHPRTEHPPLL